MPASYHLTLCPHLTHPPLFFFNTQMCWTQGKPDKLMYLRKAKMWYLTELCSPLEALEPGGVVYQQVVTQEHLGTPSPQRWDQLGAQCCTSVKGAP